MVSASHLKRKINGAMQPKFLLFPPVWFQSHAFSFFSPGRTSGSFDNEIVMMNHVYKERFPKVRVHSALQHTLLWQLRCMVLIMGGPV